MSIFLDFNFLVILNLFVILLWGGTGYYRPAAPPDGRRDVIGVILLILTVIAVIADIIFMVRAVH